MGGTRQGITAPGLVAGGLGFRLFLALLDRDDSSPELDYLSRSVVDSQKWHELISSVLVDDDNLLQAGPLC
ncbi:hypothetical protein VTH06DRAFT_8674 [Thermothelomyces fergusii]